MTHLRRGDTDLHNADGTHRTTSPSTSGHMIEQYERRISIHMSEHKDDIKRRADARRAEHTNLTPPQVQSIQNALRKAMSLLDNCGQDDLSAEVKVIFKEVAGRSFGFPEDPALRRVD